MSNVKNFVRNVNLSNITHDLQFLWHLRLRHINFSKVSFMFKNDLIPQYFQQSHNCKTCMLNKITRTPFKSVERKSKILDLLHSDHCDFDYTPSLGNKLYVIIFMDNYYEFFYVYLLHEKRSKALDFF